MLGCFRQKKIGERGSDGVSKKRERSRDRQKNCSQNTHTQTQNVDIGLVDDGVWRALHFDRNYNFGLIQCKRLLW